MSYYIPLGNADEGSRIRWQDEEWTVRGFGYDGMRTLTGITKRGIRQVSPYVTVEVLAPPERRAMTVEELTKLARQAEADGFTELAEILDRCAIKLARFNERSPSTLEEIRTKLGDQRFWELWNEIANSDLTSRN